MISHFFIDRPIFAGVLSVVLLLGGGVAMTQLPIAQYPEIAPPTVQVMAVYPGANARVVAETVAAPIEQQVNGVENMLYMSSQCTNDGVYNLTVTFAVGTDLNIAQVLVQNRVNLATPQLPDEVNRQGVTVKKKSPSILLVVNLISPDGSRDQLYLSNYATIQIRDELARLTGVGDVGILGQQDYSMRVWLDPDRLAYNNLTASDVVQGIREQNVQVAAGQIGQEPVPAGQAYQFTLSTLGRLSEVEQFQDIIVKIAAPDANGVTRPPLRLKDLGRVELTAKNQDVRCTLDGQPSVGIAIYQLPGSNALATADSVRAKMAELKARFPDGVDYSVVYDTTPFIRQSIEEVVHAFRDAFILVAIVVLVFLQSWRAAIIPLIAVPVSIIGTFVFMAAIGFSLNNISLFGLILAIGIVVDDAIVVVENVERWLHEGLTPREAARKAMEEVTGPIIAVSLVLIAVFVPCAFISGITGQFFQQFAVTIAVSTAISAFNSLTLSPALCAVLLRPRSAGRDPVDAILHLAIGSWFNWIFTRMSSGYGWLIGKLLTVSVIVLVLYAGLLYLTYRGFTTTPVGFIPQQDKGYLLVTVQLPDAASVQRTDAVMAEIDEIIRATPGVAHTVGVSGMSFLLGANGSNFGSMFVILDDFDKRRATERSGPALQLKLQAELLRKIQDATVGVFGAPPVDGLGTAAGFKIMVEDRGDLGLAALDTHTQEFIAAARDTPGLAVLFTMFRANTPQLYVDVDRTKCKQFGVPLQEVFNTLQVYLGGAYVNDFNRFGRTWQVNVQAEAKYRVSADVVKNLQVRNDRGEMVRLGSVARIEEVSGPVMVTRYNMYPAAPVNGQPTPGTSSGEVIKIVEDLAERTLPRQMTTEWTEIYYLQILAGSTAIYVFAAAVVLVFLVLAAQYESLALPLAVILVVPMCLLSSLVGVRAVGLDMNIFVQIGFVVLVGLAAKNAILIVEFAKVQREAGASAREATVEASRIRLRPILMTSFAFILGVLPLVLGEGAGAEMRRTLGIAVFSGMLGVTLFGLILTPVFYFVVAWLIPPPVPAAKHGHSAHEPPASPKHSAAEHP
jgi:multidrug efflux pump